MDKFIYAASVKELQLCGTAAKLEDFVRLYVSHLQRTILYSPWNGRIRDKEECICWYKLLSLALKLHAKKSRKILPDFMHKVKRDSHNNLLNGILGFDNDAKKGIILTELIDYETFLDWFEFDDLITLPTSQNYVENLNNIIDDKPLRFEIIFNNSLTQFDFNSTNLGTASQQFIYAIRYKQVNFPDKPQTIWDLFLECTRKQAYDISQEEADREVLKLEQHITAIKSFKDFYGR